MTSTAQEPHRALVPTLIFLGTIVAVISSLGAPLIPDIAAVEDVPLADAQWSLTVTLLSGAVATPLVGRLGDGPHRRRVVLVLLGSVVAGCVLAALPVGLGWLLAGRALQGLALALTPVAIATARDVLVGERSRATAAALSVTTAVGVGLGYPLSGAIAQLAGVHAAFAFGAGISALGLAAAWRVFPRTHPSPPRRVDLPGALLLALALTAGLLVLGEGESWGWSSARLRILAAIAVGTLLMWAFWQLRTSVPLVDLRLARGRTAATAHLASLLIGAANYLIMASVPRLVQTPPSAGYGFGASVFVAGLALVPFSLSSLAAGRVARFLGRRLGERAVLPLAATLVGLAQALFGLARGSLWEIFLIMAVAGLGTGCAFAALPGLVVSAVPGRETGSAMGLNQVLRYVGFSVGTALSGALLEVATPAGAVYPLASGYTAVAVAGSAICALMLMVTWLLPHRSLAPAGGSPGAVVGGHAVESAGPVAARTRAGG